MTHHIKYIMVGGFLGAGKTTLLGQLAKEYTARGLNVGIITNDQATDLVDTNNLRSQGFRVGEVAGACFCCNFNELMDTAKNLSEDQRPDVLLAEPVGSCTDLVATVIQPIKHLFDAEFDIAPYTVILKPSHGRKVLKNEKQAGFSPKAAYILRKQLEEADAILINRIDELKEQEVDELSQLIQQQHPDVPTLKISAKTGTGIDGLLKLLDQRGDFGQRLLDIDYDIYAEGEAELGWLNCSLSVQGEQEFSLDQFLVEIVSQLQRRLSDLSVETAHLKVIGLWEGFFGVANLISSDSQPELSLPSHQQVRELNVIVNARVACDPQKLNDETLIVLRKISEDRGLTLSDPQSQYFRPGRPVPTHRYSQV